MSDFLESLTKVNIDKNLELLREDAKKRHIPIIRDKSFNLLLNEVRLLKPKKILEIGMAVGLSAIGMLFESENSTLSSIEIDEEAIKEAEENFKKFNFEKRVNIFKGDASMIIPNLTGKYDFIFLDGPKGHYNEYLPYLLEALNVNGVLFCDNVLFRGYVDGKVETPKKYNTTVNSMREFLKKISDCEFLRTTVLDIDDGVSISLRLK